jgi:hypothetical protein
VGVLLRTDCDGTSEDSEDNERMDSGYGEFVENTDESETIEGWCDRVGSIYACVN